MIDIDIGMEDNPTAEVLFQAAVELRATADRRLALLKQAYYELQRFDHVADQVLIEEIGCELAEELKDVN